MKLRCYQGYALSEGSRGEVAPCRFLASSAAGNPWCSLACRHITHSLLALPHGIFPVSISLILFFFFNKGNSHAGLETTLTEYELILTCLQRFYFHKMSHS